MATPKKSDRKKLTARVASWVHDQREWFAMAKSILDNLDKAREGGLFSKAMATAAIAGTVLEKITGHPSAESKLEGLNYHHVDSPVSGFLCEILEKDGLTKVENIPLGPEIRFWGEEGLFAGIYNSDGEFQQGPYILGTEEDLDNQITRCLWSKDRDIMLVQQDGYWFYKACRKFDVNYLTPPGPYIGQIEADFYLRRLKRYGDKPRTLLIQGPTGCGKSVLARNIAAGLGGLSRTLKIEGKELSLWKPTELPELIKYLRPSVLLIDDLQFGASAVEVLGILESLRVEGRLVIITRMVNLDQEEMTQGGMYVEGLRPGRIDEVITLRTPEKEDRNLILRHYFENDLPSCEVYEELLERTEGLTGAYLAEVVDRIRTNGIEYWEEELENVLYFAPPPPGEDEEDEDEDDLEEDTPVKKTKKTKKFALNPHSQRHGRGLRRRQSIRVGLRNDGRG